MGDHRAVYLTTFDLHRLDLAVSPLRKLSPNIYLVGSVLNSSNWRDVDVRMILSDEDFDEYFEGGILWEIFCLTVTSWLRTETRLPIDFQVQRQTQANENHNGPRNHLSGGRRSYAGMGDGTDWGKPQKKPPT